MQHLNHQGFTLIELVITVALIGVLLALGIPQLSSGITNSRIRTAAEGLVNGMQLARSEAVRRNTPVDLRIGADGMSWDIVVVGDVTAVQTRGADAGSGTCVLNASWACTGFAATSVRFNGVGMMVSPNTGSFAVLLGTSKPTDRAMCAAVIANTPKLCDPTRTDSTDPQACFAYSASTSSVTRLAGCPAPP